SFQLQSYKDQMNTPTAPEDKTGPTLQSWTLGTDTLTNIDKTGLYQPGDPIVLNFNEPVSHESLADNVTLIGLDDAPIAIDYYTDGASLIIKPKFEKEKLNGSIVARIEETMNYVSEDETGSY